ncbi:hypothetical protein DLAC_00961 [Tieghemostelium lacteum]|uniref:NAD(P)-binding domain-containing protein n=1 Tax=Tieghemostelium lacteum TaxID=361077 RepID=A0A152A7Y7_TIELA|nr:hypothetical protein DLAC_00961 [Tieghemostelium lacteum]|eukprot:KYR02157.1 hypothetical protein DLAC_00961 [Tieghemostelium lacteum]
MKFTVIGGTGLIGSKVVNGLRALGHEVLAASPKSGVNAVTGEGLDTALKGVDVVIDVSNSPPSEWQDDKVLNFFKKSGENLFEAEKKAAVKYHVALSVVGTDKLLESGYFRAKQAQEDIIKKSGVPYTIVQATQFFEFVDSIYKSYVKDDKVVAPTAFIQPISSDDVAKAVVEIAVGKPTNSIVEVGGPEKIKTDDLIRQYLSVLKIQKEVVSTPGLKYFGATFNDDTLCTKDGAKLGSDKFINWISKPENQKSN